MSRKHCGTNNICFSHSVFKRLVLQASKIPGRLVWERVKLKCHIIMGSGYALYGLKSESLTLSQTTNFKLFQTEKKFSGRVENSVEKDLICSDAKKDNGLFGKAEPFPKDKF